VTASRASGDRRSCDCAEATPTLTSRVSAEASAAARMSLETIGGPFGGDRPVRSGAGEVAGCRSFAAHLGPISR
jgi:hypothetical protein